MTLFPKVKIWHSQRDDLLETNRKLDVGFENQQDKIGPVKDKTAGSFENENGTDNLRMAYVNNTTRSANEDTCKQLAIGALMGSIENEMTRHILWEDIELIRLAGIGSDGSVYKASLTMNLLRRVDSKTASNKSAGSSKSSPKCNVACKRFSRDKLCNNEDFHKKFIREIKMLTTMKHPNITQFLGLSEHGPFVWQISEFVRFGSLLEVI